MNKKRFKLKRGKIIGVATGKMKYLEKIICEMLIDAFICANVCVISQQFCCLI